MKVSSTLLYTFNFFPDCRYLFDINAETFRVADFIIHEDFNKVIPFEADLALIMVTAKMLLDRRKQKALLMKNDDWMNEKANVSASGWGWTKVSAVLKITFI